MKKNQNIFLVGILLLLGTLKAMEAPLPAFKKPAVKKPALDTFGIPAQFIEKLLQASSIENYLAVVREIHKIPCVKNRFHFDQLALVLAAHYGHTTMLEALIKKGFDIKAPVPPVLIYAVQNGQVEAVKLLIRAGSPVTWNALLRAMQRNRQDIAALLIVANPDIFRVCAQLPIVRGRRRAAHCSLLPPEDSLSKSNKSVLEKALSAAAEKDTNIEGYKKIAQLIHKYHSLFPELENVIGKTDGASLDFSLYIAKLYEHKNIKDALIKAGAKEIQDS